jgi:hypothetical protein
MRKLLGRVTLLALSSGALCQFAHAGDLDFGVTIRGEVVPGVYGRVDLGQRAPPPVVFARPMVIEPAPPDVVSEPLYLHVPPEHAHAWRLHCHEYHACNRPVYFVRSREYDPGYAHRPAAERHREEELARGRELERARAWDHEHGHERGDEYGHDHDHDHGRDHDHDHDHDHDRDH